jgi:hypothetical protein
MLLQVMSEEKTNGFQTTAADNGTLRIESIGRDPWLFKQLSGAVALKRPDAAQLKVTALDFNGHPVKQVGTANAITLTGDTVYYLISR